MGIHLDQINDPKLRKRIIDTMQSAECLKKDIAHSCPSTKDMTDPDGNLLDRRSHRKRIRQSSKPLMNKLETEFFNCYPKDSPCINVQSIRFKLGNGIWYKPDFVFIRPSGTWTCYEIKGPHAFRGGFENLKVAASKYPLIQWVLSWKQFDTWQSQIILP